MLNKNAVGSHLKYVFFGLCMVALSCVTAYSEDDTMFGREFRFAYLPTLHSPGLNDSLHVIVQSDSPSSGVFSYTDRDGIQHAVPFDIQGPDFVWQHALHWEVLELQGIHDLDNVRNIKIYDHAHKRDSMGGKRIHTASVTVNNNQPDVQVFMGVTVENTETNPVNFFTGADYIQVTPNHMLGTQYAVQSWPSDGREDNGSNFLYSSSPSHFAVVGVYPNTPVEVELSNARGVFWNTSTQYTIVLDVGEVVYFAANVTQDLNADLSGSTVFADKPVAVFSGHVAAEIPSRNRIGISNLSPLQESRDPLQAQSLPLTQFGETYVVAPLTPLVDDGDAQDAIGIVNGTETADVFVNGVLDSSLPPFGTRRINIMEPTVVTASDSIGVSLLAGSANTNFSVSTGDPAMIVLADASAWPTTATWSTPHLYEGNGADLFTEHHVLLATPTNRLNNILLNGVDVSSLFTDINGTYAYYQTSVSTGRHTVVADTGVMVVAYGFGTGCSYGFNVGRQLRDIPILSPVSINITTEESTASPGETIDFPIVLADRDIDIRWFENGPLTVELTLNWNASLLHPQGRAIDSIVRGRAFTTVTATLDENTDRGAELSNLSMLVGLGDALVDQVTIASVAVMTSNAIPLTDEQLDAELTGSLLYIDNVWLIDGKPRLINTLANAVSVDVSPNPATQTVSVSFKHASSDRALLLYDNLGRLAADYSQTLIGMPDSGTTTIDVSGLPRGTYTLRLTSGEHMVARLITLE